MSLRRNRLWTIGSGKGGVGKSLLTASMGIALARAGHSVIVVDANLAAPNLHAYFGVKAPACTLVDVLEGHAGLADALVTTSEPRVHCLSCVGDDLGMADITPARQLEMSARLTGLETDFVLIDGGSGGSLSVLDWFNFADEAIVVASPDPAAMQCSYAFIKNAIFRRVQKKFEFREEVGAALLQMQCHTSTAKPRTMSDLLELLRRMAPDTVEDVAAAVNSWHPIMIINMATSEQDQRIAEIIQTAARKFLNVDIQFYGSVPFDVIVRKATQRANLLDVSDPDSVPAREMGQIALQLAGDRALAPAVEPAGPTAHLPTHGATGLNDNLVVMGRELHVQTEDLGDEGGGIITQVFCGGRVLLSTKSEYTQALRDLDAGDRLAESMRAQHYHVICEIETRKSKFASALAG
jgi:flagellar biosynthesis protein FlhG